MNVTDRFLKYVKFDTKSDENTGVTPSTPGQMVFAKYLNRNGYMVGKYISLESKIAKNKNAYYDALEKAQAGWDEGKEDVVPFIKYLLGTIISAYRDFEDRMEIVSESESALDMVKKAVANKIGKFTKMDIVAMCPSLSNSSVESSLKKLAKEGVIEKKGASRATYYVKIEKI